MPFRTTLRRTLLFLPFFQIVRPVERTLQRAHKAITLAIATLIAALVALVIIAIGALLWIISFVQHAWK